MNYYKRKLRMIKMKAKRKLNKIKFNKRKQYALNKKKRK